MFRDTKSFNFQATYRQQAEKASTNTLVPSSADRKQQVCRAGTWYLDRRQARGRKGKVTQAPNRCEFHLHMNNLETIATLFGTIARPTLWER